MKPILSLDFDGVVHSYVSGWKGARTIPDPPVAGALEFIVMALEHFRVAIYSSRSGAFLGRYAMKRWLHHHLVELAAPSYVETPEWWRNRIGQTAFADPWEDEVKWAATKVVREIMWPSSKPPAFVSIDDRAFKFSGRWPHPLMFKAFKTWQQGATLPMSIGEVVGHQGPGVAIVRWSNGGLRPVGMKLYSHPRDDIQ